MSYRLIYQVEVTRNEPLRYNSNAMFSHQKAVLESRCCGKPWLNVYTLLPVHHLYFMKYRQKSSKDATVTSLCLRSPSYSI